MSNSKMLYLFFLFFIKFSSSSSSSSANYSSIHKCSVEQRDALLLFKQNLSVINGYFYDPYCKQMLGTSHHSITWNWNISTDCCHWGGVVCNKFTGHVIGLDLRCGMLQGATNLDALLSSLSNLEVLDLSYNGLTVVTENATAYVNPDFRVLGLADCKLTMFPDLIRAMKNLEYLDLSKNNIDGHTRDLEPLLGDHLEYLYLQSNMIHGPFPLSICNMSNLLYLDMSNNRFDGVIPQCFGDIVSSLAMINLRNNSFHGTIPDVHKDCGLSEGLFLNGNKLEGKIPNSLFKCNSLKALDLGHNYLNGTFRRWLGDLPKLEVLVLRSNKLHGTIGISSITGFPFQSVRIFDVSNNEFEGQLPTYFDTFHAIKDIEKGQRPKLVNISDNYYSIRGIGGGSLPQLMVSFTIVDLSSNKFEGKIWNVIGNLENLVVLNLSHNNFNGEIPHSVGNLSNIEALDLSSNQLTGDIPQEIINLHFLAILNLSQNHLVGRIPEGNQLQTFEESTYGGNLGLCGMPLPKQCPSPSQLEEVNEGDDSIFTWKAVMLGYGCGTLLGLAIGHYMLSTGKPKWFSEIVDRLGKHITPIRQNKTRYIFIGK